MPQSRYLTFCKYWEWQGKRPNHILMRVAIVVFELESPFDIDTVERFLRWRPLEGQQEFEAALEKENLPDNVRMQLTRLGRGMTREGVQDAMSMLVDSGFVTLNADGMYEHSQVTPFATPMCENAHVTIIAGTCPWCGSSILNTCLCDVD